MKQQAATCEICGEPIYVETQGVAAGLPGGLDASLERAAAEHLLTHPSPVLQRFLLRKHLDELSPSVRPIAVKQVYSQLRQLWGDEDTRGVYSIDEALGSAALYRLWTSASRCTWDGCRHTEPA
jgi:hypothetical protein